MTTLSKVVRSNREKDHSVLVVFRTLFF